MKTILTIILALMLVGCGEDDMAHIGEEIESTLDSTNVTDDTQTYDATAIYIDGEIVQKDNNLYTVFPLGSNNWDSTIDYIAGDEVIFADINYSALRVLADYPCVANYREYSGPVVTPRYFWYRKFGNTPTDIWSGSGTTIVEAKPPSSPPGTITYDFTLTDPELETYDVVIDGAPAVSWTIKKTWGATYAANTYFVHNERLYQVIQIQSNRMYNSPDAVEFLDTDWEVELLQHSLTQISVVNQLKPFDGQNITPAIFASPMTYKITGTEEFNAFTLAKVKATSITYTFRDELANIVKTATSTINLKRDENGILSDYPTTVVFYADQQMPIGSTVEISLTYSENIELGDFTLNNMIDSGFTNLAFSHAIKDFNDYTPDAWGNIPESVKAIVTTFQISVDVPLTNYDYAVSFNESIAGKNVTVDASDSNGEVANGSTIFGSLIRRVRITNPAMKSNVKDGDLGKMATLTMKAQEIA